MSAGDPDWPLGVIPGDFRRMTKTELERLANAGNELARLEMRRRNSRVDYTDCGVPMLSEEDHV